MKNELAAPDSIFAFYQKLIRMRKEMPLVQEGLFVPLLEDHEKVFAYQRVLGNESLICLNNFYGEETEAELDTEGYEIVLANYKDAALGKVTKLRPYETIIAIKK